MRYNKIRELPCENTAFAYDPTAFDVSSENSSSATAGNFDMWNYA